MSKSVFLQTQRAAVLATVALALVASGCSLLPLYAYTNTVAAAAPLTSPEGAAPRASLAVDGKRGNPRVLMFLALSGGGSRSAYFSSQVMLKLQTVLPEVDLLREVDVLSAVSGGSLPAAYYALSRDESLKLPAVAAQLLPSLGADGPLSALAVDSGAGTITCSASLSEAASTALHEALPGDPDSPSAIIDLCTESARKERRVWRRDEVSKLMGRNYLARLFGNFFWPTNILKYWFTPFDRADIMAQTFADNLFDAPVTGRDLSLGELNSKRPFLILNSTNASEQILAGTPQIDEMPFGSVFTFTAQDFQAQLASNVASYSVARAVMASSAFPVVFPAMTLRDFRPDFNPACTATPALNPTYCGQKHYMHVFDGGNADNLGLKSVKRVLLQQHAEGRLFADYDSVIVLVVDAFATPSGTSRTRMDPRGPLDFFVDTNVTEAVDSLLRLNRLNLLKEFDEGTLKWHEKDCSNPSRELPSSLCALLAETNKDRALDLRDRLVFYHIGFDDVLDPELAKRLNRISTSYTIDDEGVAAITEAVNQVLTPTNPCLLAIGELVKPLPTTHDMVRVARAACRDIDVLPKPLQAGQRTVVPR